jgi:hypothetical protein
MSMKARCLIRAMSLSEYRLTREGNLVRRDFEIERINNPQQLRIDLYFV